MRVRMRVRVCACLYIYVNTFIHIFKISCHTSGVYVLIYFFSIALKKEIKKKETMKARKKNTLYIAEFSGRPTMRMCLFKCDRWKKKVFAILKSIYLLFITKETSQRRTLYTKK